MPALKKLLNNNQRWAEAMLAEDPHFFARLVDQQAPQYLWIGCSDSRVPANEITGLHPGEVFVHRNVANLVIHCDMNLLSVLQFAVEYLKVRHIIVCGHYGCGGVRAALEDQRLGLIDNWLRPIRRLAEDHHDELAELASDQARLDRLCELNAIRQAHNLAETTIIQNAWEHGQVVSVNAWIYAVSDGQLKPLLERINGKADLGE